jgi:hypothetical protein
MVAAIFALIGAALGVLGTLITETVRARAEGNRVHQETLRLTCADFTSALTRMRELSINITYSRDSASWESIDEATLEARIQYERLRLVSTSVEVQKAGRHALRYTYGVVRQAAGKLPRDDEQASTPLILANEWQLRLYAAVREELNLPSASDVYREPEKWLAPVEIRQVVMPKREMPEN